MSFGTSQGVSGTASLDTISSTRGSIVERGATAWVGVAPGTTDLPLVSNGAGADPAYEVLGLAGGGTSSTTASAARTALGLAIGTDVQAFDAQLSDVAAITPTDNQLVAGNGTNLVSQSLSSLIDEAIGSTRGSILERGASSWVAITPGASGTTLTSNGAGADPSYQARPWTSSGTNVDLTTATDDVRIGAAAGTAKLNVQAEAATGALQVRNSAGTLLMEVGRLGNDRTEAIGFYDSVGSDKFQLSIAKLNLASDFEILWRSVANWFAGVPDIGITRDAAGVVRITDGSTGIGFVQHGWRTTAHTSTPTAVASTNSGRAFTNEGASGEVNFTLPGASAGLVYRWFVQATQTVRVTAAAGDTIRIAGSVSAAAGNVANGTIGGTIELQALNATEWFATFTQGAWTVT